MNATFIHPTSQAGGIPTAMPGDNSHPVKVFVAFEDEGIPRPVTVVINRAVTRKACIAERCRLRETIQAIHLVRPEPDGNKTTSTKPTERRHMKAQINGERAYFTAPIGKVRATLAVLTVIQSLVLSPLLAAETSQAITDNGIATAVKADLQHDKSVLGAAIAVQTSQGIVSLSGAVDNLLAKERAVKIAESVRGVRGVVDRMVVTAMVRPDAHIRKDILMALLQDPATESYQVAVAVKAGVATLTGTVGSWAEKQLAAQIARGVKGLTEVRNEVVINYLGKRTDQEIAADVISRLQWDIWINGDPINAAVKNGAVTLTGTTSSAIAKARAFDDAWAYGVTSVDESGLKVEPGMSKQDRRESKKPVKSDSEIKQAIQAALHLDPRVAAFTPEVIVTVEDGVVILGGDVGNMKAKSAAEQDARNTVGVSWVDNLLTLRPFMSLPRDSDTERALKASLAWDPLLEGSPVEAAVINHVAYLSGAVNSNSEKAEAQDVAARTKGVLVVRNHLKVEPEFTILAYGWPGYYSLTDGPRPLKSDEQIKKAIEKAFFWSPFVHSDDITVTVDGGVATLTGTVGSWIGLGEADNDAHKSGASIVLNRLKVK